MSYHIITVNYIVMLSLFIRSEETRKQIIQYIFLRLAHLQTECVGRDVSQGENKKNKKLISFICVYLKRTRVGCNP